MASKDSSVEVPEKVNVKGASQSIGSMFGARPKTEFVNCTNEELSCSPKPSDLVYIRSCTSCTITIGAMAAKCIVEGSKDVTVKIEKRLCAGMLEIIHSNGITVDINPQFELPTVSIDLSANVCLKYHLPEMIGHVYATSSSDVRVCLDPPHKETHPLDLPNTDDGSQYVAEYKNDKMQVDKVVREGAGYPTTAEKKEKDDKKQEMIQERFEAYVLDMFKGSTVGKLLEKPADVKVKKSPDNA